MLVLQRKKNQRLLIGQNIVVTVTKIEGNRVTLGVQAPKDVSIIREEVEKRRAA